jgi:uncharacterized repeat protein (TIGR01451 family)
VKNLRIAALFGLLALSTVAAAQLPSELDYRLEILEGGIPIPGGNVVYALIVTADWSTNRDTPFTVTLNLPPGFEPVTTCDGDITFDAATRVLTWSDGLSDPLSCPIIFRIDPSMPPGTVYKLDATLAVSAPDRNPSNNSATYFSVVRAASDVEISITSDRLRYRPGDVVTYTITIKNNGPQDAYEVAFTESFSPHHMGLTFEQISGPAPSILGGTTVFSVLRVGESATFRRTARAKTDFESADIRFGARVQSANVDLYEHNNENYHWTFAGPEADLALAMTGARISKTRIPVTIHVNNDGPDAVTETMVWNALSTPGTEYDFVDHVRIVSVAPSQGTCTAPEIHYPFAELPPPAEWIFDCSLGTLAPGAKARIDLVIERISNEGPMELTSIITPTQNDAKRENNMQRLIIDEPSGRRRAVRR